MGDNVEIHRYPNPDKYGRTRARIFIDGQDYVDIVLERLVAVYWAGKRHDWCGPRSP